VRRACAPHGTNAVVIALGDAAYNGEVATILATVVVGWHDFFSLSMHRAATTLQTRAAIAD
jgi:hypothetical protein